MPGSLPHDLAHCRILNAAGTLTRLSGARVSADVASAMAEAAGLSFDMWALQASASTRLARATGAEAGLVTTGAAAGLTLAAAAAITGLDAARMDRLPETVDGRCEILVPRTHRNGYDRALRAAGARLIDVGTADRETDAGIRGLEAWEVIAHISAKTVAIAASASPATEGDLPLLAEIARTHDIPLIVDAAAQLPPRENLRRPLELGATLVVYSGGKAIGGPQASGILAGRRDLIASAALQMLDMDVRPSAFSPPAALFGNALPKALPRHGIGRGFKASKEAIVGLLAALEAFLARDEAAEAREVLRRLQGLAQGLADVVGLATQIVPGRREGAMPRLALEVARTAGFNVEALATRLAAGQPSVRTAEGRIDEGVLLLDLAAIRPEDDGTLVAAIRAAMADGNDPAGRARSPGARAEPNPRR
jgi:D-glucosaminate-6-phosphate ammonia-lyase